MVAEPLLSKARQLLPPLRSHFTYTMKTTKQTHLNTELIKIKIKNWKTTRHVWVFLCNSDKGHPLSKRWRAPHPIISFPKCTVLFSCLCCPKKRHYLCSLQLVRVYRCVNVYSVCMWRSGLERMVVLGQQQRVTETKGVLVSVRGPSVCQQHPSLHDRWCSSPVVCLHGLCEW